MESKIIHLVKLFSVFLYFFINESHKITITNETYKSHTGAIFNGLASPGDNPPGTKPLGRITLK